MYKSELWPLDFQIDLFTTNNETENQIQPQIRKGLDSTENVSKTLL